MLITVLLLGALLLGLLSWGFGTAALLRRNMLWSGTSLACCALSLLLACGYLCYEVLGENWDSLMDTANTLLLAAVLLTVVNLGLALTALLRGKHQTA